MSGETTSTSLPQTSAGPPAPVFDAEALARRIDADMSAVFAGRGEPVSVARPWWRSLLVRAHRLSAKNLGALAAAGLVGLAAGMMLMAPRGARVPDAGAIAGPRAQLETTRWISPIASAPEPLGATSETTRTPRPVKGSRLATPESDCRSAQCAWQALTAADRRLRRSYAAAARAGVPRRVLAVYREDWSDARRAARRRPAAASATFTRLAAGLDREARRARRPSLRYALKD